MKFWDLPDDVLNVIYEYSNNYHVLYQKFVRKFFYFCIMTIILTFSSENKS